MEQLPYSPQAIEHPQFPVAWGLAAAAGRGVRASGARTLKESEVKTARATTARIIVKRFM